MMLRAGCSLLCFALLLSRSVAAEPSAAVRVSLAGEGQIWVGQRVVIVVDLRAPGIFKSAAVFDLPRVPGLIMIPPSDSPVLGSDTVDDVSFTTQRHEIAAYSQRGGKITIPSFQVRFDSASAFDKPTVANQMNTSPLDFTATLPPGAERLSVVITTNKLEARQTWQPNLDQAEAKPGDAFTRTITMAADNVPAMVLPAIQFTAPDGVRSYPQPSSTTDTTNRGEQTGTRIEKVTYVCEQPGEYTLPALEIAWWNPEEGKLHKEVLTGASWKVVATPADTAAATPAAAANGKHDRWRKLAGLAAVLVVVMVIAIVAGSRLLSHHELAVQDLERTRFQKFEQACRRGNARETLTTLRAWSLLVGIETVPAELAAENAELDREIRALQATVFGRPDEKSSWSNDQLLALARRWRRTFLHQQGSHQSDPLPPLNPAS